MAKINYPKGEKLARLLLDVLARDPGYEKIMEKKPYFHIKFECKEYYLYFKCVTHEGNPYPLEQRRAQLPRRPEFDAIKSDSVPFLFLGYDVDNDVYVCWEPSKVKLRLNNKAYVSFYSRLSIQESVEEGKIREEYLTNGDKFVLFKRKDAISFFQMIDTHFEDLKKEELATSVAEDYPTYGINKQVYSQVQGRILSVEEDESVVLSIDSLLKDNKTELSIVASCMNEFGPFYPKMGFKDWANIIRKYVTK